MAKITKSFIDGLEPNAGRLTFWDDALRGFGVRISASGVVSFVIRYRVGGGGRGAAERLHTIGRYGVLTVEEARKRAKADLGLVANGGDPGGARAEARAAITVRDLADDYMKKEVRPKRKPSTISLYQIYFDKHVEPDLGKKKARDVTRADVAKLHRKIGVAKQVTANRVLVTLSAVYNWAQKEGLIPEGVNPCTRIERFREQGRERFLTSEELSRLGASLALAETEGLPWVADENKPGAKHAPKEENRREVIDRNAVAAIRLLLFTGCRLREILHLRWEDVDAERGLLHLPDSKTGRKTVVLNAPALEVLASLDRLGRYVIAGLTAGTKNEKPRADLHRPWSAITRHAGLTGVRIHDLRHTHASVGAGAGMGLPIIGKLLGHKQASTTERYAHLHVDPLLQASNRIGNQIAAALNGTPSAEIVSFGNAKHAQSA
jgi:integrase